MKRLICASILFVVAAFTAVAEIAQTHFAIPSSEKEFSVDFIELKGMKYAKFPKQEDMHVTRAYKVKGNGSEGMVTYSLFKDTGVSKQNMAAEVFIWTMLCTMNISGRDDIPQPAPFKDSDVKGEFNGDCGTTNMLIGPFKNDFLKDYSYAAVESFYKKGQGLVVRVSMANDLAFFGRTEDGGMTMEAPYFTFYDSFRFRDIYHFEQPSPKDDLGIRPVMLDGMKEIKWRRQKNLPVSSVFQVKSRGLEGVMTLSLFGDTGVSEEDYEEEVYAFTRKCLMDIMGVPESRCPILQNVPVGEDEPITCILSSLVRGKFDTDFLKGYGFFQLESFYVQGEGLAVRVFLANSPAFFGFNESGEFQTAECPVNDFYSSLIIRQ